MLLLFVGLVTYVWYHAQERAVEPAPAVIVLGAAAWGNKPSPVFKERIAHAVYLYEAGLAQKLIFTGGALRDDVPSEGKVGARWAIKQGVAPQAIAYESTSRDTWHNLKNAKVILQEEGIDSVILVSDYFHLARAGIMARDLDLQVQLSPTPTSKFNQFSALEKLILYSKESYLIIGHQLRKFFEHNFYQAELSVGEAVE
ncbi:YdcF family protein [Denitrificimonas sp. JX-1]|uniref:YdcF family protein n=1 Tax=Denitrificimonas halotolerans TaxID=3098930 RepID=A0ABU5GST6_9GAMM|nr:YdcF family protein [Denitrificimonas sp. JX-1]MDY7220038.1 YdcF family protein [Denitrificimonas sp. JX-1]